MRSRAAAAARRALASALPAADLLFPGVVAMGLLSVVAAGPAAAQTPDDLFPDPLRFEAEVAAFALADETALPPPGAIVCVGSSSLRFWTSIAKDLAPLTVVPRGFGGSTMSDLLHYADRLVTRYEPRAVLVYEGDNDLEMGMSPELVRGTFDAFVTALRERRPFLRIWVLSIKPSPARLAVWPDAMEANRLLAEACAGDEMLHYVDVASAMLDEHGEPIADLFLEDCLHLNERGYERWATIAGPILRAGEERYESYAP